MAQDGVDKSFEARVFANLDQQTAALKTLELQQLGVLLCLSLLGIGIAVIGRDLTK